MDRIGQGSTAESLAKLSLTSKSPSLALMPSTAASRKALMVGLAEMCLNRGEAMDSVRLASYSTDIAETATVEDALLWMREYGRAERGEYESRIPSLGDALAMLRRFARKREWDTNRESRLADELKRRMDFEEKWESEREEAFRASKARPKGPRQGITRSIWSPQQDEALKRIQSRIDATAEADDL